MSIFSKDKKDNPRNHYDRILYTFPMPSMKWVKTMQSLIIDAEKYDNNDEKEVRDNILLDLKVYIEKFIEDDKKAKPANETTTTK